MSRSVDAQLIDFCGPGEPIEISSDRSFVRVRPSGTTPSDKQLLDQALDSVSSGGTIDLCEGMFYLGEGDERETITVTKGVTIRGKHEEGVWHTIVKGGGDELLFYSPSTSIGAFFVNSETDPFPVIIDGLWLRNWGAQGVLVFSCNSFVLKNSKVTNPVVAGSGFPLGIVNYIHGVMAHNPGCQGDFNITDNTIDVTEYEGIRPSDSNAVALYGFPSTRFERIFIERNNITTNDEGIEVLGNQPSRPSEIFVRDNNIIVIFDVSFGWANHYGILAGGNMNTGLFLIDGNRMYVSDGAHSFRRFVFDAGVFSLSGENMIIRNNIINVDNFSGGILRIGILRSVVIVDFGISMFNSTFENNEVIGKYGGIGIDFLNSENESRGNTFRLDESLARSGRIRPTVRVRGEQVCDNAWEGNTGRVIGELNRRCSSDSAKPTTPPVTKKMGMKRKLRTYKYDIGN